MTLSRNSRRKQSHVEQIHELPFLSFNTVISCTKQHGRSRYVPLLMKHKRVENFIRKHEETKCEEANGRIILKKEVDKNMCGYEPGWIGRWTVKRAVSCGNNT
jgi:hypothetical protein